MARTAPESASSPTAAAVFLSYAREDSAAAQSIAEKLRMREIEVWFDQKELIGGDAWDARIRQQIKECSLFVALVSRNSNSRLEGYFRREWKMAVDRTQDMAEERAFLLPVVIDEHPAEEVRVPEKFYDVQWFKLPGGEATDALASRVEALLVGAATGRTGSPFAVRRMIVTNERLNPHQPKTPITPLRKRRRVNPRRVALLGLLLAVGVGFVAYQFWPEPAAPPGPVSEAARPPKVAATPKKSKKTPEPRLTEERQYVAKANALWEKWDEATHGEWALAEELSKRAVELDPADGEAWAVYAQVTVGRYLFFRDTGAGDLARERAERAVQLLPTSKSTRLALANAYRTNGSTQPEAERIVRRLLARSPDDKRVLRTLGDTLRAGKKYEEALGIYDKAAALPGGDHLSLLAKSATLELLGRYQEAEAAVDQALAVRRGPAAMLRKVGCLLNYHGDLNGAAKLLARVPASALLDDRAVSLACQLWLWKRQPDNCLEVLNSAARDFMHGYYWSGAPRNWLLGKVHQLAGRPAAAEAQWRLALKAIEKARAERPDSIDLIFWSANVLARLDRKAEAEKDLDLAMQLSDGGQGGSSAAHVAAIKLLLGRKPEALNLLESKLTTAAAPLLRIELRYEPAFDELRGDPRFEAMLAAPKVGEP